VTEAEIFEFASRWDPQPYHVDPVAAASSTFGAIVASGIHTLAVAVRLGHDALLGQTAAAAGVGIDNLRFLAPLRPGQQVAGQIAVLEISDRSSSRRGQITFRIDLSSQADGVLLTFDNHVLVWRRGAVGATASGSGSSTGTG
jgi:acyl dehydratase